MNAAMCARASRIGEQRHVRGGTLTRNMKCDTAFSFAFKRQPTWKTFQQKEFLPGQKIIYCETEDIRFICLR